MITEDNLLSETIDHGATGRNCSVKNASLEINVFRSSNQQYFQVKTHRRSLYGGAGKPKKEVKEEKGNAEGVA